MSLTTTSPEILQWRKLYCDTDTEAVATIERLINR